MSVMVMPDWVAGYVSGQVGECVFEDREGACGAIEARGTSESFLDNLLSVPYDSIMRCVRLRRWVAATPCTGGRDVRHYVLSPAARWHALRSQQQVSQQSVRRVGDNRLPRWRSQRREEPTHVCVRACVRVHARVRAQQLETAALAGGWRQQRVQLPEDLPLARRQRQDG